MRTFIYILVFTNIYVAPSFSDEPKRISQISELKIQKSTLHYRLPNAKVAWVDFDLMRADFPQLKKLNNGEIENWILDQFAYISEEQLKLRGLRTTDFEVGEETKLFHHPDAYHRSAVAEAELHGKQVGLVDLKGTGHSESKRVATQLEMFRMSDPDRFDAIRTMDHSDGVASLGESIAETSRQRAVQAGFDLGKAVGETVENYFIIDTGFDILKKGGEQIPAGIMGRQPHVRGNFTKEEEIYSDDHGFFQRSESGASVDFGGVKVNIPEVKNQFDVMPGGNPKNPQEYKPWSSGHEVARDFREKAKTNIFEARGAVYKHMDEMLGPLDKAWQKVRSIFMRKKDQVFINQLKRAPFSKQFDAYWSIENGKSTVLQERRIKKAFPVEKVFADECFYVEARKRLATLKGKDRSKFFRWAASSKGNVNAEKFYRECVLPEIESGQFTDWDLYSSWLYQYKNFDDPKILIALIDLLPTANNKDLNSYFTLLGNNSAISNPEVLRKVEKSIESNEYLFRILLYNAKDPSPELQEVFRKHILREDEVGKSAMGHYLRAGKDCRFPNLLDKIIP